MTNTEKAALEQRIDELCQENERLRTANAAFTGRSIRAGDKMACLEVENAKLRELLQRLHKEYQYMRVRPRQMYLQHEQRMRSIEDEMRELGIEVD